MACVTPDGSILVGLPVGPEDLDRPFADQFGPLLSGGPDRRFADVPVRLDAGTHARYGFAGPTRDRFRAWLSLENEHGPYADVDVFDAALGRRRPTVVAAVLPGVDPTAEQAAFRARAAHRLAAVCGPLCGDSESSLLSTPGPRVVTAVRPCRPTWLRPDPDRDRGRGFALDVAIVIGVTACLWACAAARRTGGGS